MDSKTYKQELLNALYEPYKKCLACPLGAMGRTQVVFGDGDPDANIMFIGEGPGHQEDLQGKPFVGRSGNLLNHILESIGINRHDVFISNVVKCRPPNNRKPTQQESNICKSLLLINQIKIIRPKIICTLGASAIQGLLDEPNLKITKIHGTVHYYEKTPVIPAYHPAYILRNPKQLETLINDIRKTLDYV